MPESTVGALGANIRRLREVRGLSQDALAAAAGLDRAYLGKIERGAQNVSILTAARIADALGTMLATMMEGVSVKQPDGPEVAQGDNVVAQLVRSTTPEARSSPCAAARSAEP